MRCDGAVTRRLSRVDLAGRGLRQSQVRLGVSVLRVAFVSGQSDGTVDAALGPVSLCSNFLA